MQLMVSIGDLLGDTFGGIWLVLDTIVFGLINSAYKIFMAIASARLLSSDVYFEIANRIYIVIGVVMLFVLSYSILKAIIDPDQATKGELGAGTVKRVVIAVVGLAITPVLFNVLYQAQGLFLEQDVIGKVFFRMDTSENAGTTGAITSSGSADAQIKNIGGSIAAVSIWKAFFYPTNDQLASEIKVDVDEVKDTAVSSAVACGVGVVVAGIAIISSAVTFGASLLAAGAALYLCSTASDNFDTYQSVLDSAGTDDKISLEDAYNIAAADGNFNIFLAFSDNFKDGEITYLWFVSTVCGAFCLYAFASFSIDMGVRAAKLAYYQIIAPIPLIMQVLPKFKDNFNKYISGVISTFLEVFVRISIVYIVVYVISHLQELFSTSSSLWANQSLNVAEKSLAMALLILGLVIFAKSAPDLITSSLGIQKGSMKLGIGKKLADGGAYAAGGAAGAGYTAIRRNWHKALGDKDPDKRKWRDYANAAMSAVAGGASATARAAYNQLGPGPDHKPAMNFRDAMNVAGKAAQEATDARDNRDERQKKAAAAINAAANALVKARSDYNTKEAELVAAGLSGDALLDALKDYQKKIDEAYEAYRKAQFENSAIGIKIQEIEKKREAWVVGTVSTAKEEAAMKFGTDLDALKGKLREEAYKKDSAARRLHTAYNTLKSEPIKEYADGWDEQSANTELRRRRAEIKSHTDALGDLRRQMIAPGVTDAEYSRLKTAYEAEVAALERKALINDWDIEINADGSVTERNLLKDIKIDVNKARIARDNELEGLRMAMEAAADEFVRQKAVDASSNTYRDIATFLSEHATYINQNQDMEIALDANGDVKKKLSDVMIEAFGAGALQGKFTIDADVKTTYANNNSVKFELPKTEAIKVGSETYSNITYKLETVTGPDGKTKEMYVPYGVDDNGNVGSKITGSTKFQQVEAASFFDVIAEKIASGSVKKATSETSVAKVADIGKASATYVRNTDYADKVSRKRQAEDAKGGGKK